MTILRKMTYQRTVRYCVLWYTTDISVMTTNLKRQDSWGHGGGRSLHWWSWCMFPDSRGCGLLHRRPRLQFSLKGSHLLRRQPLLLQQSLIATYTQTESQAVSQLGSIQQSWYTKQQCKVHYHFDSNCMSVLLHSRRLVPFKGKYYVSHMLLHLAGTDKHMDNLCKQRAYCFHHSFVIIHTEGGQSVSMFCGG